MANHGHRHSAEAIAEQATDQIVRAVSQQGLLRDDASAAVMIFVRRRINAIVVAALLQGILAPSEGLGK